MSTKPYAMILLLAAGAAAVASWGILASLLAASCAASLMAGLTWKRVMPTLLAGCLLYPVLAVALARVLPPAWSVFASGLFVIVVCERLTFEYELSVVLESPTGIDEEARSRASEISRAHARRMSLYIVLAVLVIAGSAAASAFTVYASELIAAAMLLMLTVLVYATR